MTTVNEMMARLLLPEVVLKPEEIFLKYPKRTLNPGTKVTRFAPSPTGMLHVGGLYAALVFERLAHQTGGICYLRIEDTDKKREVKESTGDIINSLDYFGIHFDEGPTVSGDEKGSYGPYKQSGRAEIYKVFVRHLVAKGLAYPCFCSAEELVGIRAEQEKVGEMPGYYGKWAKNRNITLEQAKDKIEKGVPYVIRLKSPGYPNNKVKFKDLIKGSIEMPENHQDIVILKTDGLPTYHFAHAVDDHLMGTTHVMRADEWLSSVPVHLQLFDILGFKRPEYGHISPIMKLDGASKRKFSKRKDLDGMAEYYRKQGYPGLAVVEYFMGLINSNYEDWREKNPSEPYTGFIVEIERMSVSGSLLDINKLNNTSRDVISRFSGPQIYEQVFSWAAGYDLELFELLQKHREYVLKVLNIGRLCEKPRKDITMWSEFKTAFSYFFDELFYRAEGQTPQLPSAISRDMAKTVVASYMQIFNYNDDKDTWFEKIKEIADKFGFAADMKHYRKHPESFKGNVGDIAMLFRVILTNRTNTPDLYDIMQVMGADRVLKRFKDGFLI